MAEIGVESRQPGGSLGEMEEGKRREEWGLFIGMELGRNGRAFTGIEEGRERLLRAEGNGHRHG
jgi:hypothetical protein